MANYDWKSAAPGIGAGLGQLLGGLFAHKGANPADAANQQLSKIPGAVNPYFNPYKNAGADALSQLRGQYGQMTNSPGDFYNNMASGYQQSPGYQRQMEQGLMGSNNAAAAGGMLGTPYHQEKNTQLASDIASQDFEKYLQNVLGIFGQGQKGYEHINDMGYDANKQLADYIAQVLGQKSQNSFEGQTMENQFNQERANNIFGGLGSIGSGMLGGWGIKPPQANKGQ